MRILFFLIFTFAISLSFYGQVDDENALIDQWMLQDSIDKDKRLFRIKPYKKLYFLVANYTTDINQQPYSANKRNQLPEPLPYNQVEVKFQLSFKTRALNDVFGKKIGGDLWFAYTQSSRWQLYNKDFSSPFRETNYEPEVKLMFATPYKIFGLNGVYSGVGFNHQSNGRSNPLSRSWNRIIFDFGLERENWSVVLRPWFRIQENSKTDDNPNIEDYVGCGELLLNYAKGKHNILFTGRNSLNWSDQNRGSVQLDYSVNIYQNLKLHFQFFHGYGESLIDYNHSQTTFGVGVSLL